MTPPTVIEMRDVHLRFGGGRFGSRGRRKPVFLGLDWHVKRGQVVGICGRNGAGKSSLLRLVAGTLKAEAGLVVNRARHPALLTLGPAIEARLPGRLNVVLLGLYLGYRRKEILDQLDEIIEFSELSDVIDDPVYTYSTGMRARLSFSVALHLEADLLLIDEILSVGDPEFRKKSGKALKEKVTGDSTAIIVSNNTNALSALCDAIFEIRNGIIHAVE